MPLCISCIHGMNGLLWNSVIWHALYYVATPFQLILLNLFNNCIFHSRNRSFLSLSNLNILIDRRQKSISIVNNFFLCCLHICHTSALTEYFWGLLYILDVNFFVISSNESFGFKAPMALLSLFILSFIFSSHLLLFVIFTPKHWYSSHSVITFPSCSWIFYGFPPNSRYFVLIRFTSRLQLLYSLIRCRVITS